MKKSTILYAILLASICIFSSGLVYCQMDSFMTICSKTESIGRCTGSAYCTACSNCSRCKHCNSGGSCGVCSNKKSSYKPATTRTEKYSKSKPASYNLSDDPDSEYYLQMLVVDASTLNLRKGPGTDYEVIMSLKEGDELIFLANKGGWVKVRVISNEKVGFVDSKYVLLSD